GHAPNEEKPAAPDEEWGTVNFKAVWSGFKAAGWTSKPPPRGIGTLWKYILPGRDANGAEGVDYLLGEQAVVNHAVQRKCYDRFDSSASDSIDEDDEELFAKEERHFADKFLESLGGEEKVLAGDLIGPALKDLSTTGWDEPETPDVAAYLETPYQPVADNDEYPELWQGRNGPRKEAIKRGASPSSLFFLFMPVAMWQHIAECSNFYMHEQLDNRVDSYFKRKEQKDRKDKAAGRAASTAKTKTRRDVRQDFLSVKPVMPHELCVYIGLLIARAIMPNREKLVNHWRQDD
ncbi:hypothetical protein PHYSODRAFT_405105, partial [Phytophthora sojae]